MVNYYDEIKEKLLKNEIYAKVKDYSKERNKVLTYFEVGKLLSEAGKKYGNDVIGSYAEKLVNEVGKKLEEELGVKYLHSDFKKKNGFKRSVELTAQYDMYRQDYCGCIFSLNESKQRQKGL